MKLRCNRHSYLLIATLTAALSTKAIAGSSLSDPFDTESLTPRPPILTPPASSNFVPCQPLSPPATTYGVLEVVDQALCRNPQTREAWANARVQAALVGVAQADYLPDLNASAGTTRLRTDGNNRNLHSAALTLSWLLYDFGARDANLEYSRQLLSAATSTLDASIQSVFLAALQSYYNAQAARAALTAALESEKASRESLTAAETRYRIGTATPADHLQARTAWSQAVLNRIRTEGGVKSTLGTLANVMGLDANQAIKLDDLPQTLPEATFERDIEALITEARRRRPDLQAAEAQVRAAQANVDYTRAQGQPTLSLGAGPSWQRNDSIDTHGSSIGLTLTWPIFSGFDTTYRVRAAEARVESISAQQESIRQQVALEVWTSYQNLITATHSIRTTEDLLASAEQSERVALGRYKAGVGTILDVLNAQSALAAARLQRIQATLDWYVSRATLARSVGTLDNRMLNPVAEIPIP